MIGQGVAGSGGFVPRMLAVSPPNLGNLDFKLALTEALGGSIGVVGLSLGLTPVPIDVFGITLLLNPSSMILSAALPLAGTGPGGGFTTLQGPMSIGRLPE